MAGGGGHRGNRWGAGGVQRECGATCGGEYAGFWHRATAAGAIWIVGAAGGVVREQCAAGVSVDRAFFGVVRAADDYCFCDGHGAGGFWVLYFDGGEVTVGGNFAGGVMGCRRSERCAAPPALGF